MSLLKGILPDSWILKLFTPNEDDNINKIYLTIHQNDSLFILNKNVTRYTVIEFIRQIHNNYDEIKDNINMLAQEYFELDNKTDIHTLIRPFMKEEIVFMTNSEIEIEHNKNEEGYWITDVYKNYKKDKRLKLATLAAHVVNDNIFSDNEISDVDE